MSKELGGLGCGGLRNLILLFKANGVGGVWWIGRVCGLTCCALVTVR